jgi:GDP-D-mannose dehydratase
MNNGSSPRVALVTGVTGQDGSNLAELCLHGLRTRGTKSATHGKLRADSAGGVSWVSKT